MPKSKSIATILYRQLLRWFVKKGWPWIVENIWPTVEKMIVETFDSVADNLKGDILEWYTEIKTRQAENAKRRAEAAETRAESSRDKAEAEKHRAIAEVWREVFEETRRENEALKEKLDSLMMESAARFQNDLDSMQLGDIVEEGENDTVKLKGSQTAWQLPSPKVG